jgi:hypothetical protein
MKDEYVGIVGNVLRSFNDCMLDELILLFGGKKGFGFHWMEVSRGEKVFINNENMKFKCYELLFLIYEVYFSIFSFE